MCEGRSALTFGCLLTGTISLAICHRKNRMSSTTPKCAGRPERDPTCAHGARMGGSPGHLHNVRMTNRYKGVSRRAHLAKWLPPLAAPKSLVGRFIQKAHACSARHAAVRQCAGKTGEVQSYQGRAGNLCTCTQPALGCPTICRSCIKMAEEHGHGPSTHHSFRPSPREAPQT